MVVLPELGFPTRAILMVFPITFKPVCTSSGSVRVVKGSVWFSANIFFASSGVTTSMREASLLRSETW